MTDLINTMQQAKDEIQNLRRQNEILTAKVETMELMGHLFYSQGIRDRTGYAPDVAYALGKHIEELQAAKIPVANNEILTDPPVSL